MSSLDTTPDPAGRDDLTLRLVWPQWQGAAADNVVRLTPELPPAAARHGYAVGTSVLTEVVLPAHHGPTATVPVDFTGRGLASRDGVEAKDILVEQLGSALELIASHHPARILTVGGECSVSVAPFAALADRYGDQLAVVWIDSHPDVGTPRSEYHGYHAMAVGVLTGHGDPQFVDRLPATIDGSRVALAGLHSWTDDDYPNAAAWGLTTFAPADLRTTSEPLLTWVRSTGCTKIAIHLDVDVVDSNETVLGLGAEPGGLTTDQVRRLITDLTATADVVGFTIAEYVPRQVIQLSQLLRHLPLT